MDTEISGELLGPVKKATGQMRVMHIDKGDDKYVWDKEDEESVKVAKTLFAAQRKRGFAAYRVDKKGEPTEVMHTFDPEAGLVIFRPPMVGG